MRPIEPNAFMAGRMRTIRTERGAGEKTTGFCNQSFKRATKVIWSDFFGTTTCPFPYGKLLPLRANQIQMELWWNMGSPYSPPHDGNGKQCAAALGIEGIEKLPLNVTAPMEVPLAVNPNLIFVVEAALISKEWNKLP